MQSVVEKIQASIADKISRLETFRGIKVSVDRSPRLEGKLDEKLAAKIGMSVLVKIPTPAAIGVSGSIITLSTLVCRIKVFENIATNDTGLSSAFAAEVLLKGLTGFTPEGAGTGLLPRADYPWSQLTGTLTTNGIELVLTTSAVL